jgi:polar amino acid transport system substrate-binding protein
MLGLLLMGCGAVAHAADADQKLRVGISPFAPFVMFTAYGPEDLLGKRVAVVQGSTSAAYARQLGAFLYAYEQVEGGYDALLTGTVDAVVYDAPNLLYYAKHQGQGQVAVVGKLFVPQDYAVAVRQGSPLRKQINLALVRLNDSGEAQGIRAKWFGN